MVVCHGIASFEFSTIADPVLSSVTDVYAWVMKVMMTYVHHHSPSVFSVLALNSFSGKASDNYPN